MKTTCLAAALVLFAASGALAQEQVEPEKAEKKICKTEKITGSLARRQRICMTKSEWDRVARGTNEAMDDLLDDANQKHAVQNTVNSQF